MGVKEGGIKKAGIKKLWSIDDWEWRNQQELRTFSDIERRLDEGKIIVVNFETDQWKDMLDVLMDLELARGES